MLNPRLTRNSEMVGCAHGESEGGVRPWSAAVSQTPSLLSSVLSAYRGTGPVITGLKCVYDPSQLAAFFFSLLIEIDLVPAFTPEPNLTMTVGIN